MALADGKAAFLADAQTALEALFPGTLVIGNGPDLACCRSGQQYEDRAERGGYELQADQAVRVRTAVLATRPAKGTLCTLDGRELRIGEVWMEAGDVAWHIQLVEP